MTQKDIGQKIATNIKLLRKEKNLTQKELGLKLGYSEKTIAKWESGTTVPSVLTLVNVAQFFDVGISHLLNDVSEDVLLGIDAGGTKTYYMLCDSNGENIIKESIGVGCNCFDLGFEKATEILAKGINDILKDIPFSNATVYAGIAGGGPKNEKEKYNSFLKKFGFKNYDNGSDNDNIISAGLLGECGITLILGTGVCLYEVLDNGKVKKAGWGYLIDEGGSAYNFGIDAIKAYYAYKDGYGEETRLVSMIKDKIGLNDGEFLTKIYEEGKRYIASFAPLVFECAEKYNDAVSKGILKRNIEFVGKIIDSALLDFEAHEKPITCVLAGGISKEKNIIKYITEVLSEPQKVNLKTLDVEPVWGAVKKAKELYDLNSKGVK